jgi:uncharacterized protein (DUF2235 family)
VVLCDGTGNELGGALSADAGDIRISNVLKLYRIAEKGRNQLVHYSAGVGTIGRVNVFFRWKQEFLGVLGLVTGYGLDDNVVGAYRFLAENWQEGDRIYLLGFSRGAWTVRVLAGLIHLVGLVRPAQCNLCDNALATYKRAAREDKLPIAWHFARVIGSRFPTIHFIGAWDTVASVLVPRADRMWIPSLETLPYTMTNPSVRIFRHALALDERRRMFRVAAWPQPQPFVANRFRQSDVAEQDIEQRWFPGVHADIGGGYPERESALSKQPLIWMTEEARKAGLRVTEANLRTFAHGQRGSEEEHPYSAPDAAGRLHPSLTPGWMPLEILPKRVADREWPARRSLLGFYLPLAEPRRVDLAHSIDGSVGQRRDAGIGYAPRNLPVGSPGGRMPGSRSDIGNGP